MAPLKWGRRLKKTDSSFDAEEMPLKDMGFQELIAKGDELLRKGQEMFLDGTGGMARSVPWLAPLPNSSDPSMFTFGCQNPLNVKREGRVRWSSLSPSNSDSENSEEASADQGFQGHSTRR
jgi:hypothetical protein